MIIVGVPRETAPGERCVALVPGVLPTLARAGLKALVERGAGQDAGFPDASYEAQGASVVERAEVFASAQIVLQVRGPGANPHAGPGDLDLLRAGQVVMGQLDPLGSPRTVQDLAGRGVTAFAMELLPRISRAQPMDVLSSLATVAGYKAVVVAASTLPRMFPLLMTAAGTITPARVLVVGIGMAGLQAIATARRLGAVVYAYDIRPAVKEQVESLGARFLELSLEAKDAEVAGGYARAMDEEFYRRQRELMAQAIAESDVVITTAAVPGQRAPVLVTKEMVRGMRPGSVIVDLAAASGGNCELTRPRETVEVHGVTIHGPVSLASTVPYHASQMYAKNVTAFLLNLVKDGEVRLNPDDPIIWDTLVAHGGQVVHPKVREMLNLPPIGVASLK